MEGQREGGEADVVEGRECFEERGDEVHPGATSFQPLGTSPLLRLSATPLVLSCGATRLLGVSEEKKGSNCESFNRV